MDGAGVQTDTRTQTQITQHMHVGAMLMIQAHQQQAEHKQCEERLSTQHELRTRRCVDSSACDFAVCEFCVCKCEWMQVDTSECTHLQASAYACRPTPVSEYLQVKMYTGKCECMCMCVSTLNHETPRQEKKVLRPGKRTHSGATAQHSLVPASFAFETTTCEWSFCSAVLLLRESLSPSPSPSHVVVVCVLLLLLSLSCMKLQVTT